MRSNTTQEIDRTSETQEMDAVAICPDCKRPIPPRAEGAFTTNYGICAETKTKICLDCCGYRDKAEMILQGKYTLYLVNKNSIVPGKKSVYWEVTNWPGTLIYPVKGRPNVGGHNIARWRYDVWFDGPDGFVWHGVKYGDNTDICHVKRTKEKSRIFHERPLYDVQPKVFVPEHLKAGL